MALERQIPKRVQISKISLDLAKDVNLTPN